MTARLYNVGDHVWWAHCGMEKVLQTCPVCAGKLTVTLILGSGEHVVLPCEYCRRGYEASRGFVDGYEYHAVVERVVIESYRSQAGADGETRDYFTRGCYVLYRSDIFDTEEEARERVAQIVAAKNESELKQGRCRKDHSSRSYAWNAGFHMREAKKARAEAERHEGLAVICKDRSRP